MAPLIARARIELRELRRPTANRLEALVLAGGRRQLIWLETDGFPVQASADAFLPILVPAAMASGLPLRIDAPVSAEVIAAAHRVSHVFASWYPLGAAGAGDTSRQRVNDEQPRVWSSGRFLLWRAGFVPYLAVPT